MLKEERTRFRIVIALLFSLGHTICSAEYISPLSAQSLTAPVCVIKLRSSSSTALHTTAQADILLQVKTWIFHMSA